MRSVRLAPPEAQQTAASERPKTSAVAHPILQLQRTAGNHSVQQFLARPPVLASPGQPLDSAAREHAESLLGHDFGDVRVHANASAAESARAVGANAYTVGRDIVFGDGKYAPNSSAGRRLLAHELTHVVQQRGSAASANALPVSHPDDSAEREAEAVASAPARREIHQSASRSVQREPTKPRAATGAASIADLTAQTAKLSGKTTAGSLARQEWESLFSRHFSERDVTEGEVESRHARYLYSETYGWIDAQHFFAHIQYAEDLGLENATAEGIDIEVKQDLVRHAIGPDKDDTSIYSDFLQEDLIDAADLLWYREGTFMALAAAMDFLPAQQKALIKDFDDEKKAKLILDNAKSAWSYEDLVSNQLGVQFFRLHGAYVNAGTDGADVRARFIERIGAFFAAIRVVDDAKQLKKVAAKLPGKERWKAPKTTLEAEKKKHPELFEFGSRTHRLRIAIHDQRDAAERGKDHIISVAPAVPRPHVEPLGSQFAVYSDPVSHFEAAVFRSQLSKAIPINLTSIAIEPVAAKTP